MIRLLNFINSFSNELNFYEKNQKKKKKKYLLSQKMQQKVKNRPW